MRYFIFVAFLAIAFPLISSSDTSPAGGKWTYWQYGDTVKTVKDATEIKPILTEEKNKLHNLQVSCQQSIDAQKAVIDRLQDDIEAVRLNKEVGEKITVSADKAVYDK